MIEFETQKTPLYIQIKECIKKYIEDGNWSIGHRLPSERDMAKEIGVSRKTVSLAYKELEREGVLSSHQGRGTFVVDVPKQGDKTQIDKHIIKTIDKCFDTSLKMGMDADSFLNLCEQRVIEYKNRLHGLKIMWVECNTEQLDYFCKELEMVAGAVTPVLLQDFKINFVKIKQKLKDFDFLITTLFHVEEVKEIIKDENINILPIALTPQLESIIQIARIPKKIPLAF